MIKYILQFKNEADTRNAKMLYLSNYKNEIPLLIGQNPRKFELTFISKSSVKHLKNSFKYCVNIKKTINYSQNNWDFFNSEDELFDLYKDILFSIFNFSNKTGYFGKSEFEQNMLVKKIFCSLIYLNNLGITHGYLSLVSNLYYFNSQIYSLFKKKDADKLKNKITNLDDRELVSTFSYPEKSNDIFKTLIKRYYYFVNNPKKINLNKLNSPSDFFDTTYEMQYSEFHKTFFKDKLLIENYESTEFYVYRFLMMIVFRVIPLLDVSLIRRNHIIKLCVKNIETYYDISWRSQYYESTFLTKSEDFTRANKIR